MQKIISAIYGDSAVPILKDSFEALAVEQRRKLMDDLGDALGNVFKDGIKVSEEGQKIVLQSLYERTLEIMPSFKEELEKEYKECLCDTVELASVTEG